MDYTSLLLTIDKLKLIKNNFIKELNKASIGEQTSLSYLKNVRPKVDVINDEEEFQSISFGGTNYSIGRVKKSKGKMVLLDLKVDTLPPFQSKESFLSFITKLIDHKVRGVTFAFAYPLKPVIRKGFLDGVLLRNTKEHDFTSLIGEEVGLAIEEEIYKKFRKEIHVSVANDTVCAALSGLNQFEPETIASFVAGTGINIAFFEDDRTVVNLESGNFDKFRLTESGSYINLHTANKTQQLFEKEVSGGYLYKHYNYLIDKLKLDYKKVKSTQELNIMLKDEECLVGHSEHSNHKLLQIHKIGEILFERSASLIATQLAGLYEFKNLPLLNLITEGSLFWDGYKYKTNVLKYLNLLGIKESDLNIVRIHKGSLIGAAWLL